MGRTPGGRQHRCTICNHVSYVTDCDLLPMPNGWDRVAEVFQRIPREYREAALEAAWRATVEGTCRALVDVGIPEVQACNVRDELLALWPLRPPEPKPETTL